MLDADIYGPSIPQMLGIGGQQPHSPDGKHIEALRAHGIALMSIGFLVDAESPMVWSISASRCAGLAPGAGTSVVGTLHRIEGSALRAQVEAAGFVFDGETEVVRNPEDDHTLSVFDDAIKGRTDQFVYRFRKPG